MWLSGKSQPLSRWRTLAWQRGVTLIELIVGIVVLAISLGIITSVLGPLFIKSTDPWHQVRAAELGHSLMNEILARSYDENASRSGNLLRCNENGAPACTAAANFGPDGESRVDFDDVDDFAGFSTPGDTLTNSVGDDLTDVYRSYQASVSVSYAGAEVGMAAQQVKRVLVTITTPTGATVEFSAYKGNW